MGFVAPRRLFIESRPTFSAANFDGYLELGRSLAVLSVLLDFVDSIFQ